MDDNGSICEICAKKQVKDYACKGAEYFVKCEGLECDPDNPPCNICVTKINDKNLCKICAKYEQENTK